jgi:hypothetical protein
MPLTTATDIAGRRFGKLVAIRRDMTVNSPRAFWLCKCDCGAEATKMAKYLLNGDTNSCGCAQREMRARGNPKAGHGGATGGTLTRAYKAWRGMNERCYNPNKRNYRWYGGRGVEVCEQWRHSYPNFLADMGECPPDLTLDRIDANGHYEPGNTRWATWEVQYRDSRKPKPHGVPPRAVTAPLRSRESAYLSRPESAKS